MTQQQDNWGWRARIGIFIVASEAVPEAEWWAMLPSGVSVHAARVEAPAPWAVMPAQPDGQAELAEDLVRGARQFAKMRLNAVVVGHSSSSILGGRGWDCAVSAALQALLPEDTRVTTNGIDCVEALNWSAVQRPFVVFPPWFSEEISMTGIDYFRSFGFSPAGFLRADPGRKWRDLLPHELYPAGMGLDQDIETLYRQIRQACPPEADGVLIAGTGFRCVGISEALEQDLARPVITANQASLWRCLRLAGICPSVYGYGGLLAGSDAASGA